MGKKQYDCFKRNYVVLMTLSMLAVCGLIASENDVRNGSGGVVGNEKPTANALPHPDREYVLLKSKNLLSDDEVFAANVKNEAEKMRSVGKMQKVASYISDKYNVRVRDAEKIVYFTFLESNKKKLDPMLVLSLISVESAFRQYSKSSVGAIGLTQVMPDVHKDKIRESNADMWKIEDNIRIGTDILKECIIKSGGDLSLALQKFNGSVGDKSFKYSAKVMWNMHSFLVASI